MGPRQTAVNTLSFHAVLSRSSNSSLPTLCPPQLSNAIELITMPNNIPR